MSNREYDVIVWGASGFTGRLVAAHMLETYGTGGDVRWAMGGRNEAKLREVRALVAGDAADEIPIVLADSKDTASLEALVARTNAICTTVGPYAKYGSSLVAACAESGTHYCDLTGEVPWMRRMIEAHQTAAEASGARIVFTCGFDSIPSDLGVLYLQNCMHEKHGVYANRVGYRVADTRGGLDDSSYRIIWSCQPFEAAE